MRLIAAHLRHQPRNISGRNIGRVREDHVIAAPRKRCEQITDLNLNALQQPQCLGILPRNCGGGR